MSDEPICYCGHDAHLHPKHMVGRKVQPRGNCYASSGCSCIKYEAIELVATNIISGPTPAEFYKPFAIRQEDIAPYQPDLLQVMEKRHWEAYVRKEYEEMKAACGQVADLFFAPYRPKQKEDTVSKIKTETVISISSSNGFTTGELREFLDRAEGNHVPTPDLPVEAIFRPAQNDEPATFSLRVTRNVNSETGNVND